MPGMERVPPRPFARLVLPCLASALLLGVSACKPADEEVTYDPEEVLATAADYQTALERLDVEPVPSVHGDGMGTAAFYANSEAAEVFRSIDPGDPDATATFPRGSILVKENFDSAQISHGMLSVMAKFEEGYNPLGNDWFFAMVDLDGNVLDNKAGNGADVEFCRDCHSQMGADTDLVIGLEADQLR